MAFARTSKKGPPRKQGGQGAVEAIVALPVFLLLACLVFQLFFLGIAQVHLQYAAFYAARVGAVRRSDKQEMKRAVKRILGGFPGLRSLPEGSLRVEILGSDKDGETKNTEYRQDEDTLKVRVHWDYPLIVPISDFLLKTRNSLPGSRRPTIHLRASWAMTTFGPSPKDENHADKKET